MTGKRVIAGVAAGMIVACMSASQFASAADLFRHRHYRVHASRDIYLDDYACPIQEPLVYKPRITNYHEPLCYAARPYGISTHLYDHSSDLVRGPDALEGY